jgi:hypothetical protein
MDRTIQRPEIFLEGFDLSKKMGGTDPDGIFE